MIDYKYRLINEYKNFKIKDIKSYFQSSNNFLHNERNKIKIINFEGKNFVVKSFKIPKFINKIIYSFFKPSKAKKSYLNSIKLKNFTPKPIGYIEFNKQYLIKESFYISENFEYDFTIREPLLDKNFENRVEIFKEFANFSYNLHNGGFLHLDFSPGNILIKKTENGYEFKIVDVNRMKFIKFTTNQRCMNFAKLWANNEDLKIIIKEYEKLIKLKNLEPIAIKFSQAHKDRINFKKRVKKLKIIAL